MDTLVLCLANRVMVWGQIYVWKFHLQKPIPYLFYERDAQNFYIYPLDIKRSLFLQLRLVKIQERHGEVARKEIYMLDKHSTSRVISATNLEVAILEHVNLI
jgi:hypothetical protein